MLVLEDSELALGNCDSGSLAVKPKEMTPRAVSLSRWRYLASSVDLNERHETAGLSDAGGHGRPLAGRPRRLCTRSVLADCAQDSGSESSPARASTSLRLLVLMQLFGPSRVPLICDFDFVSILIFKMTHH